MTFDLRFLLIGRALTWGTIVAAAVALGIPAYESPAAPDGIEMLAPLVGVGTAVLLRCRTVPLAMPRPGRRLRVAVASVYLTIAASVEELVWRAFVLAALVPTTGIVTALALSSVGFALSHWGSLGSRSAVHVLTGAIFGAVFLVTGSLAAAVATHAGYNIAIRLALESDRAEVLPNPPVRSSV